LVPTDFSENARVAFHHAHELAMQVGAKLYLLHVQDEGTLRIAVKQGLLSEDSTQETLQTRVEQLISDRLAALIAGVDPSVKIERAVRRGDPKAEIVRFAAEIGADVVVVGMVGATAMETLRSAVFGSVAESVMRKAPCPTLVVRVEHSG
jgi:universal stress protein A